MTDFWHVARSYGILCLITLFSIDVSVEIFIGSL